MKCVKCLTEIGKYEERYTFEAHIYCIVPTGEVGGYAGSTRRESSNGYDWEYLCGKCALEIKQFIENFKRKK